MSKKEKKTEKIGKIKTKRIEKDKKEKTRRDLGRIAIKVTAIILAIIMIAAVGGTLVYYLTVS